MIIRNTLFLSALVAMPMFASASDEVPARPSICENETKEKTAAYLDEMEEQCNEDYEIVTENRGHESPYRSENPDANCDLGFSFPSLPGFSMEIGDLNSCELLQDVTEGVVDEVNDTAQEVVDESTEAITGDEDGFDLNLDPQDQIEEGIGNAW